MANRMILNETSYFGQGAIGEIVTEVKKRGYNKAFIVTDKDLIEAGVAKKVFDVMENNNLDYYCFDDVKQNPSIENVKNGVEVYKNSGVDYIIAIGGGSPIDTAKAIGIIINNPEFEDVRSLEGVADTKNPCVPIIAIPTTAGTAAEVTINYVITDVENKRKFVCVDPHDIPVVAIVDSDMMISMPASLAAATGMDALTHAIEGYITKGAWEMSDMLSLKSIELISRSLRKFVLEKDEVAANDMSLGQYVTGMAFSNVGLGLVHAMAHPLGALYDTPHGVANAILLPTIMDFNADATGEKYRFIAKAMNVDNVDGMGIDEARTAAVEAVRKLSKDVKIPATLGEVGVKEEDIEFLAESAFKDVCLGGNPKDINIDRKSTRPPVTILSRMPSSA